MGDNPLTARVTGIPTRPMMLLQYALSGFVAYLAGLVTAAVVNSMSTRVVNSTLVYDVILVAVIGGIGLSGGKGGVRNVIVGTLLIGILLNGMTILEHALHRAEHRQGPDPARRDHRRFHSQSSRRADRPAGRHLISFARRVWQKENREDAMRLKTVIRARRARPRGELRDRERACRRI